FLVYFVALTQSRTVIEAGGSPVPMLLSHATFAALALVLIYWEDMTSHLRRGKRE
ncbi:MAG: LPS export ABC transporter permease LptF, partial [Luminiphilus sp.]|nr:LPS export ABC transporter permease LptF [Luminiphilus sp.]